MRAIYFIALFFLLAPTLVQGQLLFLTEELPSTARYRSLKDHPSILPAFYKDIDPGLAVVDTTAKVKNFHLRFSPLIDGAYTSVNNEYRALLGVGMQANYKQKWYGRFSYQQGFENATSSFALQTTSTTQKDIDLSEKIDLRGRVSYTPNRFINLQAGFDENFIGDGSRSLFLSDYGKPYGFGQMRMNFWRMEYMVLYQFFREKLNNQNINKFGTTHYLNFSATNWLHFGLFESVVFAPKDTLLYRGFEPEYLNPMIFFRPQEYAIGSSDNVIVGLDVGATYANWTFYSQLLLDEFSLTEVRAKTKWWANKFGVQTGIKGRIQVADRPLFVRAEINVVRPYTYSHLSLAQSYTNQRSVLAHPLGANFGELLFEGKYEYEKWMTEVLVNYSLKGYDDNFNRGGNIFIPYINRQDDYGHTVGQGQHNNQFLTQLRLSYQILKSGNLRGFAEYQFRENTFLKMPNNRFIIGLRSNIWNDYRTY